MKESQISIPKSLFNELLLYFGGDRTAERERRIKAAMDSKIDRMVAHEYYTNYKTAASPEERERARQAYLDSVGIPQSFRW